ncbi:MAG: iron ABC transporter permease [Chloroflexi bacterium]|nr:iron ABC transporter permease [Chloroflexota bacterium]
MKPDMLVRFRPIADHARNTDGRISAYFGRGWHLSRGIWPRAGLRAFVLLGLVGLLLCAFALSLALGSVNIPIDQVVVILSGGMPARATWSDIVLDFRLPKALTAMLSGAALAMSGLQMQTLFRNPLAGPSTLGVNAGASLGVAVVVLTTANIPILRDHAGTFVFGDIGRVAAAGLGAAAVMALVLLAARNVDTLTLLVLGVMFGYATNAVVSLLIYFAATEQMQSYLFWTFGSFGGVSWSQLPILAVLTSAGLTTSLVMVKPLNALLLGEMYARSMGVTILRTRVVILVGTSLLAGTVTAFCGPVAFLGIATPHLCRAILGTSDHRFIAPATVLAGGVLALSADLVAQMPGGSAVLPLNAVTAFIGAPVVIWVILRQRRRAVAG